MKKNLKETSKRASELKEMPKGFTWTNWITSFNVNKKGKIFLVNMEKYKSGKKKGQYKYIEMKGLEWKPNAPRTTINNRLGNK